jgi:IS5 family transposase
MSMKQGSFYDMEVGRSHALLDKAGDPLAKLDRFINWQSLEPLLEPLRFDNSVQGGRPAWDALLMVKVLLLQALYTIADGSCEYQINDRASFKRFLGLNPGDKAPDEKTIWLWRERIKHSGLHDTIFAWFDHELNRAGYIAQKGQIVDATFVPTHKPTGKQDKQRKEGIPLTPAQAAQRDEDATFTKKGGKTYHGYKNHIQTDVKHKFIRKHTTTTASTHDSQELDNLVDPTGNTGRDVYADSAYRSAKTEKKLRGDTLNSKVHYRAYRGKPLTETQKKTNTTRSRVRARVEHIFGHMTTSMGGLMIHTIGLARATVKMTFKNLAYNMQRFAMFEMRAAAA